MKRALLALTLGALYVLHQDFWFWRMAKPLAFGFLPPGLWYHALYCIATALVLWLLVSVAWPSHLEEEVEHSSHDLKPRATLAEAQEDLAT
jgi:hypothetical protein